MPPSSRSIYTNPSAKSWTSVSPSPPSHDEVLKFHRSLPSYHPTPLVPLPDLATHLGVRSVLVKDESNRLGLPSFKILGASWATFRAVAHRANLPLDSGLADLGAAARQLGLVLFTATDGNHGRAVARMAAMLGIRAEVFIPRDLDVEQESLIREEGANVVRVDGDYDDAVRKADGEGRKQKKKKKEEGVVVQDTAWEGYEEIPGWIVDGYSTLLKEIDEQLGDGSVNCVIVTPVGVGSLAQAVVSYHKAAGRSAAIIVTVEPDTAAGLQTSLQRGRITTIKTADTSTIMTGLNCGTVSCITWPFLKTGADVSVTVSDVEAHEATQYLHQAGVKAGPCGSGPLAGLKRAVATCPEAISLNQDSVLCTEGHRQYRIPTRQNDY